MWKEHLDPSGRTPRLRYFASGLIGQLLIVAVIFAAAFVDAILSPGSEELSMMAWAVIVAGIVVIGWMEVVITVRRLHDLGRPGMQYFLLLVPGVNIYLGLKLTFERGTVGANRYGRDPLPAAARPEGEPSGQGAPFRVKVVAPDASVIETELDVKAS